MQIIGASGEKRKGMHKIVIKERVNGTFLELENMFQIYSAQKAILRYMPQGRLLTHQLKFLNVKY